MLCDMKLPYVLCALGLFACGPGSTVCPTGWSESDTAPGQCAAPDSFVSDTQASIGSGVYGFMRTDAHGGNKLVVGATVFAVDPTNATCDAASVAPAATATTDNDGVFVLKLAPGDYRVTSGEVPACTLVHVDANVLTNVALTSP